MSYVLGLKCKECGHKVPVSPVHVCESCFGPYEVEYDYAAMKGKVTRESIARGPKSLWRYKDLLPVTKPVTGFHSGFTPLKRADRLAKQLGCKELYLKDDSWKYPTYSDNEPPPAQDGGGERVCVRGAIPAPPALPHKGGASSGGRPAGGWIAGGFCTNRP